MKTTDLKATFVLALLLASVMIFAQTTLLTVTGTVTNAQTNSLLQGVAVNEKGTSKGGTVTDKNGNYSIRVERGKTLVFTNLGYSSKEVLANSDTIHVSLSPESVVLNETVLIAD